MIRELPLVALFLFITVYPLCLTFSYLDNMALYMVHPEVQS